MKSAVASLTSHLVRIYRGTDGDTFATLGLRRPSPNKQIEVITLAAHVPTRGELSLRSNDKAVLSLKRATSSGAMTVLTTATTSRSVTSLHRVAAETLSLGQSVIAVSGREDTAVYTGRVTRLRTGPRPQAAATSSSAERVTAVHTDISQRLMPGAVLADMAGRVIGLKHADSPRGVFTPLNADKGSVAGAATSTVPRPTESSGTTTTFDSGG